MEITAAVFARFAARLKAINGRATTDMLRYVNRYGLADRDALIDYAYGLATKYGEASAALSAEMYDAIAELSAQSLPAAVVAPTATYGEVAEVINGVLDKSSNYEMISSSVGRLSKQAGADTMLQNAARDGAEYAWIPQGDTCAFCIMLASNGWQKASKKSQTAHAPHIHANCDCEYSVRFDGNGGVKGYDPRRYRAMYDNADGGNWEEKLNSMRRDAYAKNRDEINAQKRSAYAKRKELNGPDAEEIEI